MAVNIKGPLIVSQAFYENVKAGKLKKIVAISSTAAPGALPRARRRATRGRR